MSFVASKRVSKVITPVQGNIIKSTPEEIEILSNPLRYGEQRINSLGHYEAEDIAFVNTHQFTEAARHFQKHGVYTFAPEGSRDFKDFWDIEEERRKNGMLAPGKLVYNERGEVTIQTIRITGEHYGFLNYAPIMRTTDSDDEELRTLLKTYKQARRVGKKTYDFPDFFDGQYHYFRAKEFAFRAGLNMVVAKSRRKGYSYMEGWDAADSINMNPRMIVLLGAFDFAYLTKPGKIMRMAKSYLDFLEINTDWSRGYIQNSEKVVELGYTPEGDTKPRGYRSVLMAVSFKDNPDAAIGTDAYKIKLEEGGKFPNLKETLEVTLSTMEAGELSTGQIVIFGTGGTKDANWEAFEDIYYNPGGYNCLIFENVWDEASRGTGCGFFYPQRTNLEPFVDEWGNSLYPQADEAIAKGRAHKKATSSTVGEYASWVGQRANCGREAFNRGSDNLFWSPELEDQLHLVQFDPMIQYLPRTGILKQSENGIVLDMDWKHPAITDVPFKKDTDLTGAVVEWFPPHLVNGSPPKNMYGIWHDPYAIDKDKKKITVKNSLAAAYVFENTNNITPHRGNVIAAAYIGRPTRVQDYNRQLFMLAERYNAEILFESDRGQVYQDAKQWKKLHLLAKEPEIQWAKELQGTSGRDYGIHMNPSRKENGALYLREWLYTKVGERADGSDKLVLHYIYDVALLKELCKWYPEGNFDRVSACIVGQYHMKEMFFKKIKAAPPQQTIGQGYFNRPLFPKK